MGINSDLLREKLSQLQREAEQLGEEALILARQHSHKQWRHQVAGRISKLKTSVAEVSELCDVQKEEKQVDKAQSKAEKAESRTQSKASGDSEPTKTSGNSNSQRGSSNLGSQMKDTKAEEGDKLNDSERRPKDTKMDDGRSLKEKLSDGKKQK